MVLYDEIPEFRHRLVSDMGNGFLIGAGAGSAFHLIRGLRNAPSSGRLAGAARSVGANMPRVAGTWAAYLGAFCAIETAMSAARGREDRWNSVAAGAATSGLFALRRSAAAAAGGALIGASFLAGVVAMRWTADFLCSRLSMSCDETWKPAPVAIITTKGEKGAVWGNKIILYGQNLSK